MMRRRTLILAIVCLAGFARADGPPWVEITDLQQIAAMRKAVTKIAPSLDTVIVVRLKYGDQQRVDATSVQPTVVGSKTDGPPAARTTFAVLRKPDRLVLFTQDVKQWKAFVKEMPVSELAPGQALRFPVVQPSGELVEQEFVVRDIIVR